VIKHTFWGGFAAPMGVFRGAVKQRCVLNNKRIALKRVKRGNHGNIQEQEGFKKAKLKNNFK